MRAKGNRELMTCFRQSVSVNLHHISLAMPETHDIISPRRGKGNVPANDARLRFNCSLSKVLSMTARALKLKQEHTYFFDESTLSYFAD